MTPLRLTAICAVAATALAACATPTAYAPAGYGGQRGGYSEQFIQADRARVAFSGNSVTSRETVEMYLLYRAAELTLERGYDWFETDNRMTARDTRYVDTIDAWYRSHYGPFWGPSWRFYSRGYWSPWGPRWHDDVRAVTRYEAQAEITMHRGPRPPGERDAFDAREVIQNLGPRVMRPGTPAPPRY
ncbi:hypothetical protein Q0812_05370 [Brevundimonas sp. 2R-24]|uniref:DUF4136 domain-containing protein n=1 Tax=Peiella sedimenti TaxID=3061083 RepID=A0ABT8SJW4_9CAUL|nr:hypothetical protein [Caulobacteraceae bacterium XZ-24]